MAIIQKEGQRGAETYPKTDDERKKALANTVKIIHGPVQKDIANILQGGQAQVMQQLPQLIAQTIGKLVTSLKGKYGCKVHIKMIEEMTKKAIDEISLIAKALGFGPIPPKVKMQLMQEAGALMDQILGKQPAQEGQMQQGPPQQMQAPQMPQEEQGLLGG